VVWILISIWESYAILYFTVLNYSNIVLKNHTPKEWISPASKLGVF
jgi:hypothetical protein